MVGALFDLSTFSIQLWPDAFNLHAFLTFGSVTENSASLRVP